MIFVVQQGLIQPVDIRSSGKLKGVIRSSKVVSGPKLIRMTPAAVFLSRCRADTTWLALPRWQADPAEMQMPLAPRSVTMLALGYPTRDTARMWGASPCPTGTTPGMDRSFSRQ